MAEAVTTKQEACAHVKISVPTRERWMEAGPILNVNPGHRIPLPKATRDLALQQHEERRVHAGPATATAMTLASSGQGGTPCP